MLIFHVFLYKKRKWTQRERSGRRRSALLAGTPCGPLKTLLEPFSVPLLGNNQKTNFKIEFSKIYEKLI